MSRLPRILPLVAIAAGGVLVLRFAAGLEGAPEFLRSSMAWAEEAAPAPAAKKSDRPASAPAAADAASPAAATVAARPAAAICAPSAAELAREAGLSPAELRVLQSLGERRGQLDAREQAFETQVALLNAAESKLDQKLKALSALKAELTGLVSQANTQRDAEIVRLVKVYELMKPKDAAAVMATLDDRVLIPVAAKMKERNLAAILAQMPRPRAKHLTEKLADRFAAQQVAARVNAAVAAPAGAAGPTPAAAPTTPATAPTTSAATAAASPRRPARPRPRPVAPRPAAAPPTAAATTPPAASVTTPPAGPARPARERPRGDGPT